MLSKNLRRMRFTFSSLLASVLRVLGQRSVEVGPFNLPGAVTKGPFNQ